MMIPFIIRVLFVVLVPAAIVVGVTLLFLGAKHHSGSEAGAGIATLVLGPILVRFYCEALIVIFRINETLTELRDLAVWAAERAFAEDSAAEHP